MLVGDETALPSIAGRLTEWPQARVTAIVAVTGLGEEMAVTIGDAPSLIWVHRPASAANDPPNASHAISSMSSGGLIGGLGSG